MSGTGRTPARLSRLRALVAGAALLAVTAHHDAQAQLGEDSALAVPRMGARGANSLPRPLAPSEALRIKRVFDLQARGRLAEAEAEQALLIDHTLTGHILADRYLGRYHRARPDELQAWLERYADHPQAPQLYRLLKQRAPRGTVLPEAPSGAMLAGGPPEDEPEEIEPAARSLPRNPALDSTVRERGREGNTAAALRTIERARPSAAYAAALKGDLAQALFIANRDADAQRVGADAARRHGGDAHMAAFYAGLAAWRTERPDLARPLFEQAARSETAPAAQRAAAAFWAARAHLRTRNPQGYVPWLMQAAQEPRTFYGLLARRALGLPPRFAWERELLGEADAAALAETAQGLRALAAIQIGRTDIAERELRRLWPHAAGNPALGRAMLIVAANAGLSDLAARLATLVQTADGRSRDFARFPVPVLKPRDGFRIDPSLVYALARLESNFNPRAVSPAGARGLMQIMPVTASYVANDPSLSGSGRERLHDPELNLELGQRYVAYLAQHQDVGPNLLRVLAAYNGGPGNLSRWSEKIVHRDDPLLFIEAIPNDETRGFVPRVLTYMWIYASRLRLPAPSLDELAAGAFPRFRQAGDTAVPVRTASSRTVN